MRTTHNLRISTEQAGQLRELVQLGWMRPTTEPVIGLTGGRVYIPQGDALARQNGWHDQHLRLATVGLNTQLYRLPNIERETLIKASPAYTQHADEALLTQELLQPLSPRRQRAWIERLVDTTAQRRKPLPVVLGGGNGATWLREGSRLIEVEGLWFLSLQFEVPRPTKAVGGCAVGVDIGLSPLAVAAGPQVTYRTAPLYLPSQLGGVAVARQLESLPPSLQNELQNRMERLHYAAAEHQLNALTTWLQQQASRVGVERLNLRTFSTSFAARGREVAVIDWLQSWLPQRLYAAGIPLRRVAPHGTSRVCHCCGRPGIRSGASFACLHGCGRMDAHVNAAHNVRQRAWGARRKRR